MDYFLKTPLVLQAIHLFLLDAGLTAGKGSGLDVHQNGDDLVAEALPCESTNLQVAFSEGGVFQKQMWCFKTSV